MKRVLSVAFLLAVFVASTLAAPYGKIKVVGVPDKYKGKNKGQVTTGLKNVGVGERVVLQAMSVNDLTRYSAVEINVQSAAWAVVSAPTGSVAPAPTDTAAGLNGTIVYFVPDLTGTYVLGMTATTDSGTAAQVTVTLTAGTYKGTGAYNPTSGQIDNFTCSPCHSQATGVFADWLKTNHSSVMPRRLDEVGGHFSNSCLACHTVGFIKFATAVNNGFDDVQTSTGWNVPPNGPGVYDSTKLNFPQLMALAGIQCENCHGPAGQHALTGNKALLDKTFSSEVCAPCHFSGDRHPKGYSWESSLHAISLREGSSPEYTNRTGCSKCHVAQGYVDQIIDGKTEPVVPSGQKIYANAASISCVACHDPHSDKYPMQLRRASVADACTGCHSTRFSGQSGLHHSHQGQMLIGANGVPFPGAPLSGTGEWVGWELPGYVYENSSHSEIGDRCVDCHMAKTPTYDPTYATPDTLLDKVGGHTFAVVWDGDTPDDPTDDILNYVGCQECHGEVELEFVELTRGKVQELLDTLKTLLPLRTSGAETGEPQFPQWTGYTKSLDRAASYNYYFVKNDGSFGSHNFLYAKGLLESSIEQKKLGAGSAEIVSVRDVPNDQGKQVQVLWNQFPAEKFSFNRLTKYGVWRMDPNPLPGTVVVKNAKNLTDVITSGPVGTEVAMGPVVWTYVAEVPASDFAEYSYVAPTLYDSWTGTPINPSIFMIAGYTADNMKLYASQPDTGYSVDNLAPVKPTGLMAQNTPAGVLLKWDSPTDPDISSYNVYRSTTAGFDPSTLTPIASVKGTEFTDNTAVNGMHYYYKINGLDFAGNTGVYSDEVSLVVSDVKPELGVPTDFALQQNYPNPFNPSTEIAFSLPQASHVKLSVYTVSGELVATLVDQDMSAGNFTATWNGQSSVGRPVSSGLYLYRIEAGDFTAVRKMVMLK